MQQDGQFRFVTDAEDIRVMQRLREVNGLAGGETEAKIA